MKPSRKQKNESRAVHLHMTFIPEVIARMDALMEHRGIVNRSEYLSTLVREDYEARGRPRLPKL
jgi:hypothetical protein